MSTEQGRVDDVVDWTVLKSIQEANATSMNAMEEYLLVVTQPEAVGSAERVHELLERSITHHERVIDHLELAASKIDADAGIDSE